MHINRVNENLAAYNNACAAAAEAHRDWINGWYEPARAWALRAVNCLPAGTEVRRQADKARVVVQNSDVSNQDQVETARILLLSTLKACERAHLQLWASQEVPDHWLAL